MERHYIVFVEFAGQLDSRAPLTQTLDVHSAGPEFSLLLEALDASPAVAAITVYNKSYVTGQLNRLFQQDLALDQNLCKLRNGQ